MFLITLEDKYILLAMEYGNEYIFFDVVTSTGTHNVCRHFFILHFRKERGSVLEDFDFFSILNPYCYFMSFKFEHNSSCS